MFAKNLKNKVKKLIHNVCHSYPGYQIFYLIDKLKGFKKERLSISKTIGYYPDLKNPKSFNEKVLYKKIYDRNPILPIVSDKFEVRQYLKDFLGKSKAQKIIIPLLYVTDRPQDIPFNDFTGEYIIKANHACKWYILVEIIENQKKYTIVRGNKKVILSESRDTIKEIVDICKNWLSLPYGFKQHEWAYQKVKRKIIIEKLLRDESGKIPDDYKFSIFHGKCQLIQVYYDRFTEINRAWYTPEWKYINVKGAVKQADYIPRPENIKSMIELAEKLGKPFDFIRVDLYSINKKIYFGELTNYPMGGRTPFNPASFDFELGAKWQIKPGYWKSK